MKIHTDKQIDKILGICLTMEKRMCELRETGFPKRLSRSHISRMIEEIAMIRDVLMNGENLDMEAHFE